jgi:hypothetical protein
MVFRILADSVLLLHLSFVVFVVAGGWMALRWRPLLWLHLPAAAWGVLVQLGGWICPLTPLENHLRSLGGQAGYDGGFLEHYLLSVLYPAGLTRGMQLALGCAVLVLNLLVYRRLLRGSAGAEDRHGPAGEDASAGAGGAPGGAPARQALLR